MTETRYFDTHAHYDDERFDPDRDELLAAVHSAGVERILNPGCNLASSRKAAQYAARFPFLYAAAGFHPSDAGDFGNDSVGALAELLAQPKVMAVGEIGLDYHYLDCSKEDQLACFERQMALADDLGLPVIIHDREAHEDCMRVVRRFPRVRGVFHCYSGSLEQAMLLVSLGYSLSFTGVVTFKNAHRALEIARWLPEDRIMLETDAPYMAPEPHRGKRNHSGYLTYICQALASLRGVSHESFARQTLQNARAFFGIE